MSSTLRLALTIYQIGRRAELTIRSRVWASTLHRSPSTSRSAPLRTPRETVVETTSAGRTGRRTTPTGTTPSLPPPLLLVVGTITRPRSRVSRTVFMDPSSTYVLSLGNPSEVSKTPICSPSSSFPSNPSLTCTGVHRPSDPFLQLDVGRRKATHHFGCPV